MVRRLPFIPGEVDAGIPPKPGSPGVGSILWPWGLEGFFPSLLPAVGQQEAGGALGGTELVCKNYSGGLGSSTEHGKKQPGKQEGRKGPGPLAPLGANRRSKGQPSPGTLAPPAEPEGHHRPERPACRPPARPPYPGALRPQNEAVASTMTLGCGTHRYWGGHRSCRSPEPGCTAQQ